MDAATAPGVGTQSARRVSSRNGYVQSGREAHVYLLFDELNTSSSIYVGWSLNPAWRLKSHLREASTSKHSTHKISWIKKIRRNGGNISLCILDTSVEEGIQQLEVCWIAALRDYGFSLVNGTDGGGGNSGLPAWNKGINSPSPMMGRKHSPKTRIQMSKSAKRRVRYPLSTESKAKVSLGQRQFWSQATPELKQLRSMILSVSHKKPVDVAELNRLRSEYNSIRGG